MAEVSRQVRQRGREWMRAVTAVYPDVTIILYPHTGWRVALDYELLGPFVDGLLEGLGPQATLVDAGQVWAAPVYSRGKLLIRDKKKMVCVDLTAPVN